MKNRKGFTIVELVIVIAVIAILAAVLIPTFTTVTANARESAAQSQAKNAQEALLSNTQGSVPENTVIAVTSDSKADADYLFAIRNRKLETLKLEAFTANKPVMSEGYYRVIVSENRFNAEKLAESAKTVDVLVKDTLDYIVGGKTSKKDDTAAHIGKWVDGSGNDIAANAYNASPVTGVAEYAVWYYKVGDAAAVEVRVFVNADFGDSCVAFVAE